MSTIIKETILPPPPMEVLELLEDGFECTFPDSYIDFLNAYNGVKTENGGFAVNGVEFYMEFILPIVSDPTNDTKGWADVSVVASQLDGRLVEDEEATGLDLIPFAALFTGDFLVLDYRDSRSDPAVAIFRHESSSRLSPDTQRIAKSFEEFLMITKIISDWKV